MPPRSSPPASTRTGAWQQSASSISAPANKITHARSAACRRRPDADRPPPRPRRQHEQRPPCQPHRQRRRPRPFACQHRRQRHLDRAPPRKPCSTTTPAAMPTSWTSPRTTSPTCAAKSCRRAAAIPPSRWPATLDNTRRPHRQQQPNLSLGGADAQQHRRQHRARRQRQPRHQRQHPDRHARPDRQQRHAGPCRGKRSTLDAATVANALDIDADTLSNQGGTWPDR